MRDGSRGPSFIPHPSSFRVYRRRVARPCQQQENSPMPPKDVPDIVVRRLPYYLRALSRPPSAARRRLSQALGAGSGSAPPRSARTSPISASRQAGRAMRSISATSCGPSSTPTAPGRSSRRRRCPGTALAHYPVQPGAPDRGAVRQRPGKPGRRLREDSSCSPWPRWSKRSATAASPQILPYLPRPRKRSPRVGGMRHRAILNYAPIRLSPRRTSTSRISTSSPSCRA